MAGLKLFCNVYVAIVKFEKPGKMTREAARR
jgi:hypothetical protein